MQRRCWGRTRNLRRCSRTGAWRFFCHDHRYQPLIWFFVLVFTVGGGIASMQSAWFSGLNNNLGDQPLSAQALSISPLGVADFRLRFCVVGYGITPEHLAKAPRLIHRNGSLARSTVEFDLRLVETIVYDLQRGARSEPVLCYESEHFVVHSLRLINQHGIAGGLFRFNVPMSLREFAGSSTHFRAYLFVRGEGPFSATGHFEDGIVDIKLL